ncbi:hypothetical protein SAMN05216466_1048 [Paraburkholderia phenazinium]|uniref:Uncharacterized protein n=2 Tax=Paraburkholderia phenazinium TaxID=60549 RepID=A0A1G7VCP8_9BURK|nr:hypothetical protein SAMN05216466_1048 [Paraburkholderia phenazinium]
MVSGDSQRGFIGLSEMDTYSSTDKLIGGALIGAIFTAAVVVIFKYLGIPSGRYGNEVIQVVAPIVAAACILLPRPLLLRTILRERRDPLLLDEDLNATMTGRALGLIGGFFIGITLCSEML